MTLYVSTWPEDRILAYFWMMVRDDADRTALLSQIASVVVQRPSDWSPGAIREEHEAGKPKQAEKCFTCRTASRRLYWHHVIAIQHGGSNDLFNTVAICLRCHAAVHPWLDGTPPDRRRRRSDWTSVPDMVRDLSKVGA